MNRIRNVLLHDRLQDPTQPEVWVTVEAEHVSATTEIRGRLMGPRCIYASTVEVAYPLRPFARRPSELPPLSRRVVIPEPSLWEPECPFTYQGPIELWEDGVLHDQRQLVHGLRYVSLSAKEMRVNGKPLTLKCRAERETRENQIGGWRANQENALLIPATQQVETALALANRFGFFVIVDVQSEAFDADAVDAWRHHPSFFGLLFDRRDFTERGLDQVVRKDGVFRGIHWHSDEAIPESGVDFIACSAAIAEKWAPPTLPKLILTSRGNGRPLPAIPGCFGVIS